MFPPTIELPSLREPDEAEGFTDPLISLLSVVPPLVPSSVEANNPIYSSLQDVHNVSFNPWDYNNFNIPFQLGFASLQNLQLPEYYPFVSKPLATYQQLVGPVQRSDGFPNQAHTSSDRNQKQTHGHLHKIHATNFFKIGKPSTPVIANSVNRIMPSDLLKIHQQHGSPTSSGSNLSSSSRNSDDKKRLTPSQLLQLEPELDLPKSKPPQGHERNDSAALAYRNIEFDSTNEPKSFCPTEYTISPKYLILKARNKRRTTLNRSNQSALSFWLEPASTS
ncbi:hypothetical protein BCR33DRAFT_719119 [Rhizoclosmatium globosum]|uniref:Uncharacterized protein n=1 Tax=Rhizoclosmatium globosum TaxID=329046 RepID=A0A1Y2C1V4_9FUNG|nr:hypothetical protein BCR33DRAFT_719119 [Rhizoclosmatium globosum]|eukprot:ORY41023.1 hypothetical protein BCR33DRAFT_719119 [Rhizoclosmatium globosum]